MRSAPPVAQAFSPLDEELALVPGAFAPSLVAETSSLVAMESLACGTPVIAFRSGALYSAGLWSVKYFQLEKRNNDEPNSSQVARAL